MGNISLKAAGLILLLVAWFVLTGTWQMIGAIIGVILILLG